MTTIHVDFNDFDPDGRLTGLTDDADGLVTPGQPVILRDADGNRCQADVVLVSESGVVSLEIRWPTWNKTNTLLDALSDLAEAAAKFDPDRPFSPPTTGLDPKLPPTKSFIKT